MLIVVLINLQVFFELSKITLKLFNLLPIFEFLGLELHEEGLYVLSFSFLIDVGDVLIIEFEVSLNKLHEKQVIIADKGCQSGLGVDSGSLGVSFIGNLISQVGDDFIEGLEMGDILADNGFCVGVYFLPHQRIEGFFIISDGFPGGADAREYFREILHPAIEILVFLGELLILFAVGLQLDCHFGVLLDEKLDLKLLILH